MTMSLKLIGFLVVVVGVCIAAPQGNYNYNPPPPPAPTNIYQQPGRPAPPPPKPAPPLAPAPAPKPAPPPRPAPPPANPSGGYLSPAASSNVPQGEGMPYDFTYGVDDAESGNKYSHVETSDGKVTEGEYRVLLPDGRTQVVKFFDNGGGFNAAVTYEK